MAEQIKLADMLSNKKLYGDATKKFVSYTPDFKSVKLTNIMTGHNIGQLVKTELNLRWQPFMNQQGDLYIVANPTQFLLYLFGKEGWKNAIKVMEWCAGLYNSKELYAKGVLLTEKIFKSMPEHLQVKKGIYWIAESEKVCKKDWNSRQPYIYYILKSVKDGRIGRLEYINSVTGEAGYKRAIRPIVHLPEDTRVIIGNIEKDGSIPERGLELVNNNIF